MDHPEFLASWQNNKLNSQTTTLKTIELSRFGRVFEKRLVIAAALPERVGHTFKFQKDVGVQLIIHRGLYLSKHLSGFRRVSFRLYSKIKFRVFRAHFAAIIVLLDFPASEAPPLTPSSIQPSPTSYQPSSSTVPVDRGETVCYCVTCIHVSGIWPISWKYTYCVNQGM